MIKAISFDFYNTLVRFWPGLEEIQQVACWELGINVSKEGIAQGYSKADVYFNRENEESPLALRSEEERREFFTRYEQMILETAGVQVSTDLARRIWDMAMTTPKDFLPFEDTLPALQDLRARGYCLGVISNLRRDMDELCQRLGLAEYLDFCVNPQQAGYEKPHAPIFRAGSGAQRRRPRRRRFTLGTSTVRMSSEPGLWGCRLCSSTGEAGTGTLTTAPKSPASSSLVHCWTGIWPN